MNAECGEPHCSNAVVTRCMVSDKPLCEGCARAGTEVLF